MDATKNFFDRYAESWDEMNRYEKQPSDFREAVSQLSLSIGSKVVDLGCGTGVFMPFLQEAVGDVGLIYSIDLSSKMIEQLQKKYPQKNIIAKAAPAESLCEVVKDQVDAVLCFSAFPHFSDQKKVIDEVSNILKPGGVLLVMHFSNREHINHFHSKLEKPICCHHLPDEEGFKCLFKDSGLEMTSYYNDEGVFKVLASRMCS